MSNNNSQGGVGFLGLLTLAFIVLKLTHVIAWSWFWVLSPLILIALIWGIGFTAGIVYYTRKYIGERGKRK